MRPVVRNQDRFSLLTRLAAEQGFAADRFQRLLLRCSRFQRRLKPGVRPLLLPARRWWAGGALTPHQAVAGGVDEYHPGGR
jgi:hypothetical protein